MKDKRELARRVAILELENDEFNPEAAEDESVVSDYVSCLMDEPTDRLKARLVELMRNVS